MIKSKSDFMEIRRRIEVVSDGRNVDGGVLRGEKDEPEIDVGLLKIVFDVREAGVMKMGLVAVNNILILPNVEVSFDEIAGLIDRADVTDHVTPLMWPDILDLFYNMHDCERLVSGFDFTTLDRLGASDGLPVTRWYKGRIGELRLSFEVTPDPLRFILMIRASNETKCKYPAPIDN